MNCLPLHLKRLLLGDFDRPEINPFDVGILDQRWPTPLFSPRRHHETMRLINRELVTGLYRWVIQIYLAVTKKINVLTYEDVVNALFEMSNGLYENIHQKLLNGLLAEPVVTAFLQNPDVKNRTLSTWIEFYYGVMLRFVCYSGKLYEVCSTHKYVDEES